MTNDPLRVSLLLASVALAACGGGANGADEFTLTEDDSSRSSASNDADGFHAPGDVIDAPGDIDDIAEPEEAQAEPPEGDAAARCGTTDGDEGTASEPIVLQFEDLWETGWHGSVGTGASCYKVCGVTGGNQFFVMSPDRDATNRDLDLNLALHEYSGAGFASEPVCVHEAIEGTQVHCPTGGTGGVVQVEGHVRFVVIDGAQTEAGGEYTFEAAP